MELIDREKTKIVVIKALGIRSEDNLLEAEKAVYIY